MVTLNSRKVMRDMTKETVSLVSIPISRLGGSGTRGTGSAKTASTEGHIAVGIMQKDDIESNHELHIAVDKKHVRSTLA